jgi:hypothetical protein
MASTSEGQVSMDTFKTMIEIAGLGMTEQEIENLKPLYDLYAKYVTTVHSVEHGAEEVAAVFHPEWPPA